VNRKSLKMARPSASTIRRQRTPRQPLEPCLESDQVVESGFWPWTRMRLRRKLFENCEVPRNATSILKRMQFWACPCHSQRIVFTPIAAPETAPDLQTAPADAAQMPKPLLFPVLDDLNGLDWPMDDQFAVGFSTLLITMKSTGPLCDSSLSPICSWRAVKSEGPWNSADGPASGEV
jgi:hypothetical protein